MLMGLTPVEGSGKSGPKHLQSYLDEYVLPYNRRKTPIAAFQALLGISAQKTPLTLRELQQPESTP
jgi:hypothetical protein